MTSAISGQNNFLASTTSSANVASATLTDNFDTFLTLLTTQLTNQDPMEPMGVSEFTQQLTEFAAIEQSIKQTEQNEQVLALSKSATALNYMNMVGKNVAFSGAVAAHSGQGASWAIDASAYAPNSRVTVFDGNGSEVYTTELALDSGSNTFEWNGLTNAGSIAPSGDYELRVEANDASDNFVSTSMTGSGTVSGVDFSGTEPRLKVGDQYYSLLSVISFGSV